MGKTISVYIKDHLIDKVRTTGKPISKIISEALEEYFRKRERGNNLDEIMELLKEFDGLDKWREVLEEREIERWQ